MGREFGMERPLPHPLTDPLCPLACYSCTRMLPPPDFLLECPSFTGPRPPPSL